MQKFAYTQCKIQELDLSENQIGRHIGSLKNLITTDGSFLSKLWLDRVALSDGAAIDLFEMTTNSKTLKSLSICENKLTDRVGYFLANMISENSILEELYLAWNNFSSFTGEPLFKSLSKNETLVVLELGWNNLGSNLKVYKGNASQSMDALCEFIQSNKTIKHFGLSNNDYSFDESKQIAEV